MQSLYNSYKDKAQFFLIYVREAHPADGWQVPQNIQDGWVILEPTTWEERRKAAQDMLERMELTIPTLIDNMDNKVDEVYKSWPDRVYVIGLDGKIIYKGGEGPWGFKPLEIEPLFATFTSVRTSNKTAISWGALKR